VVNKNEYILRPKPSICGVPITRSKFSPCIMCSTKCQ